MNHDTGVDTQALLTGDADEELRMKPRLLEQSHNAKEGASRVTIDDIRPSQRGSDEEMDGLLLKPPGSQPSERR